MHGKPVAISAARPDLSVNLTTEQLKPYKVGTEYNIYNLLREDDDWDPAGQKTKMSAYGNLAFKLALRSLKPSLKPEESTTVSYTIYPERVKASTPVKWSVSNPKVLKLTDNGNGTVTVVGHNTTEATQRAYVQGITAGGIVGVTYIDVLATPLPAPTLTSKFTMGEPAKGSVSVDYALNLGGRADQSLISWYRATSADGTDTIPVAVSRMNKPLKTYLLTTGDIGYYLVAKIEPKHAASVVGSKTTAISRKINQKDVLTKNIHTTFENISVQRSSAIRDGWWTLDTFHPVDLTAPESTWAPGAGNGWMYGVGDDATADRVGLVTIGRGARILYAQAGSYGDMTVTVNMSPHKVSGQGFGSATGQYADVYIKFDAKTLTGYGLRLQRTPAYGEGVKASLYKFVNGVGTPIGKEVYTSAFVPGCTVKLTAKGTQLTAHITSTTPQQQIQKEEGLTHDLTLTANIETNTFGGAGLQHTGSVPPGNRLMLQGFNIDYL